MNLQETFGVGSKWYDFVPDPQPLPMAEQAKIKQQKAIVARKAAQEKATKEKMVQVKQKQQELRRKKEEQAKRIAAHKEATEATANR